MKQIPCAPGSSVESNTCYSNSSLKKIAISANKHFGIKKIPETGDSETIWEALKNALKTRCDNEKCWAEQPFINSGDRAIFFEHFRPPAPQEWEKNERTWLSNFDIENVMRQYEKKYRNFDFLGVVPIDFAQKLYHNRCVVQKLCDFDVNELAAKGKTKLGCVVNLDRHDQPGSHWVAFFICTRGRNCGTYFYDSIARSPAPMITDFLQAVVSKIRQRDPDHVFRHNTIRKQYKNTECGVFCLKFIEDMLDDSNTFDKVCNEMPYDDETFRKRYDFFDLETPFEKNKDVS